MENAKVSKVEVQQQQQSDLVLDGKRQRKAVVTLEPMISSSSSLLTTGFQSLKEKSSSYFGVGGQKRKSSSMEGEGQKTLSLDVPSKKKKKQEGGKTKSQRTRHVGYTSSHSNTKDSLKLSSIATGQYLDGRPRLKLLVLLALIQILILKRGKWAGSNSVHSTGGSRSCWCPSKVKCLQARSRDES